MAAELGSRVFKLERLGHKLATPEGTPSIFLPKYYSNCTLGCNAISFARILFTSHPAFLRHAEYHLHK